MFENLGRLELLSFIKLSIELSHGSRRHTSEIATPNDTESNGRDSTQDRDAEHAKAETLKLKVLTQVPNLECKSCSSGGINLTSDT
jgi:hypothetical protein